MLDCILTSPSKPAPLRMRLLRNHDLVISNTCVDREVSQVLNLPESVFNMMYLFSFKFRNIRITNNVDNYWKWMQSQPTALILNLVYKR